MNNKISDLHIRTFTDKKFYFMKFGPEDICIEDIAHSLSNTCRYVGHCKRFYSVAEHSIRCCEMGSKWLCQMWCLLHDAAEAYIGDLSGPFKCLISNNCSILQYEENILKVIADKFNFPWPIPDEVHEIDKTLFNWEMDALWGDELITTLAPKDGEEIFLKYFKALERKCRTNIIR